MPIPQSPSKKVLLGLSGNLLSSVVAALLKHQGFQVVAIHFQVDEKSHLEAERVSKKLGLNLIVENSAALIEARVIDHIVHRILSGKKPEPTVMGHQSILIERLVAKAKEMSCTHIATGHVARVALDPSTGLTRLLRGSDLKSDQSHLLFGLNAEELKQFILPVGDLGANAIERLAIELELDPEKLKEPPPGFCVFTDTQIQEIAEAKIPVSMKLPGQIKTSDGTVVGDHQGLFRFSRGQTVSLKPRDKAETWVVLETNQNTLSLIVGKEEQLLSQEIVAQDVNWIRPMHSIRGLVCEARLKPEQLSKCRVTQFEYGYLHLEFAQPQRNTVPGQSLVFYAGDEVLGGAFAV